MRRPYHDRKTKADYVWLKYRQYLAENRVLDVGGGEAFLRDRVAAHGEYHSVGFGEACDVQFDLESGPLPFDKSSFDTVLCLDVLEHLEKIHFVFDELCRVARRHVLISLPNPWASFFTALRCSDANIEEQMKFYGLPMEPPEDRHRWFFGERDAREFIRHRAERCGMKVLSMECETVGGESRLKRLARAVFFRRDIEWAPFYSGSLWAVLAKKEE